MKIKYILPIVVVILLAILFIPVQEQETVEINAPFFKVYKQLIGPGSWVKWHPTLKQDFNSDSTKVSFITKADSYEINSPTTKVDVNVGSGAFAVNDHTADADHSYTYSVLPNKTGKKTVVDVTLKTSVLSYLRNKFDSKTFNQTHIQDFKNYMEVDSLFYGYHIYKIRVPQADLITIRKRVPAAMQFVEAKKSYADLQKFTIVKGLKKMEPCIGQFVPITGTDSIQVNVGFFIDKPIKSEGTVTYLKMPMGGPLVVIDFKGKFNERKKAYAALNRFFVDNIYQTAVMPFETYFADKLPQSENEQSNLRINYTSFR